MKSLPRLIVLVLLVFAAFFAATSAAFASKVVYDDEFNSSSLDSAMWQKANPWYLLASPTELEYYDPADVNISNGYCTLNSEKRSMNGHSYTSGIISSLNHQKFSYGYFEMRAKLPTGPGIWPAFWLVGDGLEIDALEMLGDKPGTIYMTLHQGDNQVYQGVYNGADASLAYHTYAVDWQPTYIHWFIDGKQVASYNHSTPNIPQTICFNTAVGGAWPGNPTSATKFPTNFSIDYLRVYDTKPAANNAPVADADSYSTGYNTAKTISAPGVLTNDSDADGNALTAKLVSGTSHGSLTFSANGSFTYKPDSGFSGTDSFTYVANDGSSDSAAVTVTIAVAGQSVSGPIALADAYSVSAGATLSVPASGVLVNDADTSNRRLTASLGAQPAHGTLSFGADGGFVYVPTPGYSGTDSFTYYATDGAAASGATVQLTVLAPSPTTVAKPTVTRRTRTSYKLSGSLRLGSTTASNGSIVLKVQIQRHTSSGWHGYKTVTVTNPSSTYAVNVALRSGTFRARTSVTGSGLSATSNWTKSFRV